MYFSIKIKENQYKKKKNQNPFIITIITLLLLLFTKIKKINFIKSF